MAKKMKRTLRNTWIFAFGLGFSPMRIAAISLGLYIFPVETHMIRIRYGIDFDADSRLKEKIVF